MEYKRGIPAYKDADGNTFGLLAETKEACVTDDTGEKLSDKLVKIQDGVHVVKYPDKITLRNSAGDVIGFITSNETGTGYSISNADGSNALAVLNSKAIAIDNPTTLSKTLTLLQGMNVTGVLEIEGNIDIGSNNVTGAQGRINFNTSNAPVSLQVLDDGTWQSVLRVTGKEHIALPASMYFDNPFGVYFANSANNNDSFRIVCTPHNELKVQQLAGSTWGDKLIFDTDGYIKINANISSNLTMIAPKWIQFLNKANTFTQYASYVDSGDFWEFSARPSNTSNWITAFYIDNNGVVHFAKNIDAPNIASTTALMEAQQEITDMDLQNIETQRAVTEQDINNIETQQTLTEMDLERIGGQVA